MMYKKLKSIIGSAIIVTTICTLTGCNFVENPKSKMAAKLLKPEERKFETYVVKLGNIRYEHYFKGAIESRSTINVYSSISGGVLEEVYFGTWSNVKKGDIIAKFYTTNIENRIEIQEIVVEEYEADLKVLRNAKATEDRVEKAELSLKREKSRLRQMLEEKEKYIFRSPIDGVISKITTAPKGTTIAMNEIIATVKDGGTLLVNGVPGDENLKKYYLGMDGVISHDNKLYDAKVKEINLEAKPELRIPKGVVLEFKNQIPKVVKLGDTVTYTVFGEEQKNVKLIPINFLKSDEVGKNYVEVIKDEIREKRIVEIGTMNATMAEVISGLEVNETIILK